MALNRMVESPLNLLDLNNDVLDHIISFLSPLDAISLSYTNKRAHAIPIDRALHTVTLHRFPDQLEKFRDYLTSTDARPRYMKSLTLAKGVTWEIDGTSTKPASALADILEKAVKLQSFSCGSFSALNAAPGERIVDVLASLTGLKELTLLEGGEVAHQLITRIQSLRLHTLVVDLQGIPNITLEKAFHPITRFSHLQMLSICRLSISDLKYPIQPGECVMPSVKTLHLEHTDLPMFIMAPIFPNVQRFTFRSERYRQRFYTSVAFARNISHNPFNTQQTGSNWKHPLEEAHLNVADLAMWPLSCPVRWLDLDVLGSDGSREALLAVDRTKPCILSCRYLIDDANHFWARLPVIATKLRFLDVSILEYSELRRRYMLLYLARFPALTAVCLSIRTYYPPENLNLELQCLAHDLAARNPKMRFIGISLVDRSCMPDNKSVWHEERLNSRWWLIERDEPTIHSAAASADPAGNVREISIPTDVGLKIREYMYGMDYDSQDWEQKLNEFARKRLTQ